MENKKLTGKTIFGYASAAIGFNMLFVTQAAFITYYYTQSVGISAAAVGFIAFGARIWDAFNDPIMGMFADRTNRKNGRYRPFLLWGILPLFIASILLFMSPKSDNMSINVLYAAVTYVLFGMSYTFINIPYMAMQSTLTVDPDERTKLINLKQIGVFFGIIIGTTLTPVLASNMGDKGYVIAFAIYGAVMTIGCIAAYIVTGPYIENELPREDESSHKAMKIPFTTRIKVITSNYPLMLVMLIFIIISLLQGITQTVNLFYIQYYLGNKDLIAIMSFLAALPMILAPVLVGLLAKKIEKRYFMIFGFAFSAIVSFAQYFVPETGVTLVMLCTVLKGIGMGVGMIFIFSMVADCVDYGQLKTGEVLGGLVFSTATFAQKAGGALSAILVGGILTYVGFVSGGGAQTAQTINSFRVLNTILPAVVQIVCIVVIYFYPLSKAKMREIREEIDAKKLA